MSRVLLACPEPLAQQRPAGVGIRFLEIARTLRAAGHSVTILTPDSATVEGAESGPLTAPSIREASTKHDVAVVQGHVANDFFAHAVELPTVVDLYDPFIIENLHYWQQRGDEVFDHDHSTLSRSVARGDFFLCASEAQRLFYIGFMLAQKRLTPQRFHDDPTLESLIALAPFGVPEPRSWSRSPGHAILFGGIYDWYSPLVAIEAVASLRERWPDITLTFTTHPNPDVTPQGMARRAREYVEKNQLERWVRFEPWIAYAERARFYERFNLALLTFPASVETDLSMRTRLFDFLWAELPVFSSSARGTDSILQRYDAGVVVSDHDASSFAHQLDAFFSDPPRVDATRSGARRFTEEHQWSRLLSPLLSFCATPQIDRTKPIPRGDEGGTNASRRSWSDRIGRRLLRGLR